MYFWLGMCAFFVSKLAHLNQQFLLCLHEYKEKTCTPTTVLVILTRGECLNNCLSMRVRSFFEDPFFGGDLVGLRGGEISTVLFFIFVSYHDINALPTEKLAQYGSPQVIHRSPYSIYPGISS